MTEVSENALPLGRQRGGQALERGTVQTAEGSHVRPPDGDSALALPLMPGKMGPALKLDRREQFPRRVAGGLTKGGTIACSEHTPGQAWAQIQQSPVEYGPAMLAKRAVSARPFLLPSAALAGGGC